MREGRRRGTLGHRGRSPSPLLRVLLLRTPSQSSDPTAVALELVKVSSPIPLSPSLIFGRLGSLMRFSHAMRVPTSRSVVRTLAAAPWHCGCQRCLSCGSKGEVPAATIGIYRADAGVRSSAGSPVSIFFGPQGPIHVCIYIVLLLLHFRSILL